MYAFLPSLSWLPLIELVGFFVIGGKIGFLWSLLWLMGATMFGFWLLKEGGLKALMRRPGQENEFFAAQDAFDSLCFMIAALLLIVPGFISDFIAIPFLLAPFRHWLFGHSKKDGSYMRRFTRDSGGFREWTYTKTTTTSTGEAPRNQTVIDGDFKRIDDKDQISKD